MDMVLPIFQDCIGQSHAIQQLYQAILASRDTSNTGFTHAWLITGPPGSGRSTLARGFAAGLQAPHETDLTIVTPEITQVLQGAHPDVREIVPEGLSISVDEIREIILLAAHKPVLGLWNIIIIEDADRLTEGASNALLKTIEEPPPNTVLILCAPSADPADISTTIKSRCRHISLITPPAHEIELALENQGIPTDMAHWASQVSAGHIGRARRLALDEDSRDLRSLVLSFPRAALQSAQGFAAIDQFIASAEKIAHKLSTEHNEREMQELKQSLGDGAGKISQAAMRGTATQIKTLERHQKSRSTRVMRDIIDIGLMDLSGLLRDAMLISLGASIAPIHPDYVEMTQKMGAFIGADAWLHCIDAVFMARKFIDQNVKTKLALSAMMATFHRELAIA